MLKDHISLQASQEFSAGKARNDQFRVLGYAEGAFNYLAEFRSVSEAQLVGIIYFLTVYVVLKF